MNRKAGAWMLTYNEVLQRFKGGNYNNKKTCNVICPCHNDKEASLSITDKGDKIVMKCHAGCDTEDIIAAVGLTFKDLGSEEAAAATTWKDKLIDYVGKNIEAVYDYTDENGKYLYSKVRFQGKVIRYVTVDYAKDTYKFGKPEDIKSCMYNLPAALKAIKQGFEVYITEGEKDANTLKKLGFAAVTAGAVGDWRKEFAKYFTGAKVVILPDNDEAGLKLKDKIIKDLRPFAHSIKSVITSKSDKGDVTDYIDTEKHSKEDLQNLINEVPAIVAPWIEIIERKDGSQKKKVNAGLLKGCISRNLNYKCVKGSFYWYENGYYKKTDKDTVKAKIIAYIPDSLISDNLINNIYNLMLADDEHIAREEDFNTNENYINFRNGLYNIATKSLEPHDSNILYSRQVNTDYVPDAVLTETSTFTKFICDLCKDESGIVDWERYNALAEIAGLAISNIYGYRTKKAAILHSPVGNTGKSQFVALIANLIGAASIENIPLQNMNEDKGRFVFANAELIRLIINGDQGKATIKDSSIFKSITGGDYIKTEAKGKDVKSLTFKGFIIIACNDLPYIADDKGEHVYRRFHIVPCTHEVPEKERDPEILNKMLEELPAIVNWAIEGLHRLIANRYNFTEVAAGKEYIENYRKSSDTVFSFLIDEGYIITKNLDDKLSKKALFTAYNTYCTENERTRVGVQQFGERVTKLTGYPIQRTRVNSCRDYYILGIKEENDGFKAATNEQASIFNDITVVPKHVL